ncbi:MAG TPA: D-alanine--D-alanine ligase family protein [Patescibacteria group bacterium]|nr:D-alanine--D-alanine ligase family protein [Patescibacteria group bacterium]
MSHKPVVAVLFGSRSVEHEVSVVTALQIIAAIDSNRFDVLPVYIDKQGRWLTGKDFDKVETFKMLSLHPKQAATSMSPVAVPHKPLLQPEKQGLFGNKETPHIDIVFPAVHGTNGEDGTLQGLLELADIPYVGCGVTASAVGMDKVIQKAVYVQAGLNVVKYAWFFRDEYHQNPDAVITKIEKSLPYPVIVKPADLGSSVGITLAKNRSELIEGIELAKEFDRKLLIEQALTDMIEINCSVLGWKTLETSVCEQPVKNESFLTYEDKYMRGGKGTKGSSGAKSSNAKGMASLDRLIPAPISDALSKKIQEIAKTAFHAIDGSGIARIDFMVTTTKGKITSASKVYINEINTMPGSLSFYLWEATGVSFTELTNKLIDIALERHQDKKATIWSIDSSLLQLQGGGGKGKI